MLSEAQNQKQAVDSQNLYIGVSVGGLAIAIIAIAAVAVCLVKRRRAM